MTARLATAADFAADYGDASCPRAPELAAQQLAAAEQTYEAARAALKAAKEAGEPTKRIDELRRAVRATARVEREAREWVATCSTPAARSAQQAAVDRLTARWRRQDRGAAAHAALEAKVAAIVERLVGELAGLTLLERRGILARLAAEWQPDRIAPPRVTPEAGPAHLRGDPLVLGIGRARVGPTVEQGYGRR